MSLVYDTGALIAADRRDPTMWERHAASLLAGVRPVVPVVVLAQAWRGGPQHPLSRLLRGCVVLADTEQLGRAAGSACARAGTSDVVDALVVVTALALDAPIVSSDPADLNALATAIGRSIRILKA